MNRSEFKRLLIKTVESKNRFFIHHFSSLGLVQNNIITEKPFQNLKNLTLVSLEKGFDEIIFTQLYNNLKRKNLLKIDNNVIFYLILLEDTNSYLLQKAARHVYRRKDLFWSSRLAAQIIYAENFAMV